MCLSASISIMLSSDFVDAITSPKLVTFTNILIFFVEIHVAYLFTLKVFPDYIRLTHMPSMTNFKYLTQSSKDASLTRKNISEYFLYPLILNTSVYKPQYYQGIFVVSMI